MIGSQQASSSAPARFLSMVALQCTLIDNCYAPVTGFRLYTTVQNQTIFVVLCK